MYGLMHKHLITFMDNAEQPLTIHEVACARHEKLKHCKRINAHYCCYRCSLCCSHFLCMIPMLILAPACHPTLCTDWFLKLGEDNHACALTVFRHVYEEYASNMSPPEDQLRAHERFDWDSDNRILGSAAACPVIEQTHPHTKSQSEFAQWVANEGGSGKIHHPLIWWKVCHYKCLIPVDELTLGLHTRLTQKSSLSLHEWPKTFLQSWGHQSQWRGFFQAHNTFAGTHNHCWRLILYLIFFWQRNGSRIPLFLGKFLCKLFYK